MNFGSVHYFLGIKSITKRFKNRHTVSGRIRPVAIVQGSTACHARPAERPAGPRPGGLVQPHSVAGELVGTTGRKPGNKSGGRAHRGRWSTARWGWWLSASTRDGVLTGGRVGDDSG
jgi:hypothetical protein